MTVELTFDMPFLDEADIRNMVLRVIYSQKYFFTAKSVVDQICKELLPDQVKAVGQFPLVAGSVAFVVKPNESLISGLVDIYIGDGVSSGKIKKMADNTGFSVYQING